MQAPARLRERGIDFIQRDRGFMDSIYLQDPNGLKVELACYKFETPEGFRAVDVLMKAQLLRVERGDHHITDEHLADAIELLLATRPRLTVDEKVERGQCDLAPRGMLDHLDHLNHRPGRWTAVSCLSYLYAIAALAGPAR